VTSKINELLLNKKFWFNALIIFNSYLNIIRERVNLLIGKMALESNLIHFKPMPKYETISIIKKLTIIGDFKYN
jgi:hypothetical protein